MGLKEIRNYRSPARWEIVSRHVDFKGKTVLDLGCGGGDMLYYAQAAGAAQVTGIDVDQRSVDYIGSNYSQIKIIRDDIELLKERSPVDIAICFSVLPYLERPLEFLQWINSHSNLALIECQYAGDGAGFSFLKENADMEAWLLKVFKSAWTIGNTVVEGRNTQRFIWVCE